jgi:hypothetical protein
LTTDPIVSVPLFGQSWNAYSYVLNNPLNLVDPSGLDPGDSPYGGDVGAAQIRRSDVVFKDDRLFGRLSVGPPPPPRAPPGAGPGEGPRGAAQNGASTPPNDVGTTGTGKGREPEQQPSPGWKPDPPPTELRSSQNKFNPYTPEGWAHRALFGAEPPIKDPLDNEAGRAIASGAAGPVPGLNSALTFDDPHATTGQKVFAVGTDVLSVVGVGVVIKVGGKAIGIVAKAAAGAGRAAELAEAARVAQRIASELPSGIKCFGKCVEFADRLQAALVESGIQGTRIDIDVGKGITIYSDTVEKLAERGGSHTAVRVGNMVFDNLRSGGLPASVFFEDIGGKELGRAIGLQLISVTKTPF